MKTLRITSTALAIIAAAVLACGCSDNKPEYDYDLLGGDTQSSSDSYDVDIRKNDSDTSSEKENTSSTAPDTTSGTESKSDTTSTTGTASKPDTSSSTTVIKDNDLPKENNTSSSSTDTSSSTTSEDNSQSTQSATSNPEEKPKDNTSSEPAASSSKLDENGFPVNPTEGQIFYDSTGQKWKFKSFTGMWIKSSDGPAVNMEEIPRHSDTPYGEGEIILH